MSLYVNMYLLVFLNERSPNNGAAYSPVESNWTHRNTQRSLECFNCKWNMKKKEKKPCILIDCYQYCLLLAFKDPLFFALFSSTLFFSRLKFSDINIGVKKLTSALSDINWSQILKNRCRQQQNQLFLVYKSSFLLVLNWGALNKNTGGV